MEINSVQTQITSIAPLETRAAETRAAETRTEEIRTEEIRTEEIRTEEIRAEEVRKEEIRVAEIRAAETRSFEAESTRVSVATEAFWVTISEEAKVLAANAQLSIDNKERIEMAFQELEAIQTYTNTGQLAI